MKVRELLGSIDPVRLTPGASVRQAVRKMVDCKCGSVLIQEEDGTLRGIFTERDLMTRVIAVGLDPDAVKLEDVMSREVFTAAPDNLVKEVRQQLKERHIRHVPVIEKDKVIAVLSVRDLIRADLAEQRAANSAMDDYIRGKIS
ncbi:MAG: signal transduction protein [Planctomycetes bacterium]|nr:signal transduction protein [Planctomycetota bacterium]